MKNFIRDMKVMYNIWGKALIKEYIKIQILIGLIIGTISFSLNDIEILIPAFLPTIAFVIIYFVQYFGYFKRLIREVYKEAELGDKYESMLNKFNRRS